MRIEAIFPTPVAHAVAVVGAELVGALVQQALSSKLQSNDRIARLSHSRFVTVADLDASGALRTTLLQAVENFGTTVIGERRSWKIKEAWINVMEPGGNQGMHLHANSIVSGVLYLTQVHESARLVFHKPEGGQFVLSNAHDGVALNTYNAARRQAGDTKPGDLILFPSHLLHSVPVNLGSRRVTIAFNAIPDRVSAWGYELALS